MLGTNLPTWLEAQARQRGYDVTLRRDGTLVVDVIFATDHPDDLVIQRTAFHTFVAQFEADGYFLSRAEAHVDEMMYAYIFLDMAEPASGTRRRYIIRVAAHTSPQYQVRYLYTLYGMEVHRLQPGSLEDERHPLLSGELLNDDGKANTVRATHYQIGDTSRPQLQTCIVVWP